MNLHTLSPRSRQSGLTLVEFMVSIALGMLLVAAVATLIANQSATRADLDKSGRMLENGRYAMRTIAEDAQMAGYWGEISTVTPVEPLPDPCSTTVANIQSAMGVHVQGYDQSLTAFPSCITADRLTGTDVLVIRHADPAHSDVETAGAVDFTKVKQGQVYLQTGLDSTGVQFASVMAAGSGDAATDATAFSLKKKDKTTVAPLRKVLVHIYFISKCSVKVAGSCDAGDGGSPIPTLKRVELTVSGTAVDMSDPVTLAEGIENLQVDYGIDTAGADGSPDSDVSGAALTTSAAWADVMTLKIHLLARTAEAAAGHDDSSKSYVMGTGGTFTPATAEEKKYKRHLFVQSVRLVNPVMRRAF